MKCRTMDIITRSTQTAPSNRHLPLQQRHVRVHVVALLLQRVLFQCRRVLGVGRITG